MMTLLLLLLLMLLLLREHLILWTHLFLLTLKASSNRVGACRMLSEIWPEKELPGWQIWTKISFRSPSMWISWRSFTHEIMVREWVAIVLSSHIPCCTPTHWYIPLLARWASHDSLWPIRSLSLAYLFSPGLGASSCALCIYCLDRWVLWVNCVTVRLFHFWVIQDSSFLHCTSSLCLSLSFVSILSIIFASIFPFVMMTHSHSEAASEACHTLCSTLRFWSKSFSKKKNLCSFDVHVINIWVLPGLPIVLRLDHQRSFWVWETYSSSESRWEHCTILFSMDLGDILGVRFGFPLH